MKTVVLIQPEESEMSDFFKNHLLEETPYAVRFVGQPILSRSLTMPPNQERLTKLKEERKQTVWDENPITYYEYAQPSIEYWTKEDFEKGVGIYSEFLNEWVEEYPYEFKAILE